MAQSIKVGTYEGTGAAINIELGWIPDHVRILNSEDGDAGWNWFAGMADGTAIAEGAALAALGSNGVTPLAGDRLTPLRAGFTVGTSLSEIGKTHYYVAMRSSHD